MAYAGAIARQPTSWYRKTTRTWTDATKVIRNTTQRTSGFAFGTTSSTVSGVVYQNSSPVVRTVRVYRRDNGDLLGTTTSDGSGNFSFKLNGYTGKVFVIAFDDITAAPDYNAQIYDLVVPA